MSLTILLPPEKSRVRALLDHFYMIEDRANRGAWCTPCRRCCCWRFPARLPIAPNGASASGVPALLAALSSRRSGRPVADRPDESHRSSAVLRRLHGLGAGDMARSPGPISTTIRDAQADYLLAREGQPADLALRDRKLLRDAPPASLERTTDVDKGHGRIEQRTVTIPARSKARWRSPVSRRTPPPGRRDDRPGGLTGRAQ
jgi:hypothetical protein